MITATFLVKITVDDENIEELYPNYKFNWDTPEQFIDYLAEDALQTPTEYDGYPIDHLVENGFKMEVIPRQQAKVMDLELDKDI